VVPDILTDQTSAHDPLNGYLPSGTDLAGRPLSCERATRTHYQEKSLDSIARHVGRYVRLQKMGSVTFDYGNNIRTFALSERSEECVSLPGICAGIHPSFILRRSGPFRWVALSGEESGYSCDRRSGIGAVSETRFCGDGLIYAKKAN